MADVDIHKDTNTTDLLWTEGPRQARPRAIGRDRQHLVPRRSRQLRLRLSCEEHADIAAAARQSGLTPTGYAAEVILATAREAAPPVPEPLRVALADLLDARTQLRGFTTNVHIAAAAMHRDGHVPDWLRQAVTDAAQAVARVDAAAAALTAALR